MLSLTDEMWIRNLVKVLLKELKKNYLKQVANLPQSLADTMQWIETNAGNELKKHMTY